LPELPIIPDTVPSSATGAERVNDLAVTDEAPGRYEVLRELARGGQAKVFVAFDHHLGREVAMKVPRLDPGSSAGSHAQTVLRFLREARITARLEHPNIVPIHEIGRRADGSYYCTQRLIRPSQDVSRVRTLRTALSDARTPAERLLLLPNFVAICNAVAHAHSRGVLHRDLKPDNVVIGALGETVVLDWGLGRIQGDPDDVHLPTPQTDDGVVSLVGHVMGTPSYMSPEQALGAHDAVTERSDVWSLGAILYELLTGYPPFLGATPSEVVARVKSHPVLPVLSQNPDAPRALAAVAMKALQRAPVNRYPSAQVLASDVSAWLADLPVRAYRYNVFEQVRLFAARNKTASFVGLVAVGLLAISIAFFFREYRRARSNLAEVFVARARSAETQLQWDAAAAYYAAARVEDDRPVSRMGSMLAANRSQISIRKLVGHNGSVHTLARSPDGKTLASGSFDRTARLWDVETGTPKRILSGHQKTVTAVAFSPDGRWLATASEDSTARLWDLDAGTAGQVIATSGQAFNAIAFSHDSHRVALGGEDRRVWLVSLDDGGISKSPAFDAGSQTHSGPVYAVGFTLDDSQVASASWDRTVRFWSTDGSFTPGKRLQHHNDSVLSLKFSPDGKELATGARDGTVLLYELDNLDVPAVLGGHEQKVYSVDFSPDNTVLASGGTDRSVRLWLAGAHPQVYGGPSWRALVSESYRRDKEVSTVAFLNNTEIASAGRDGEIFLRQFEAVPNPSGNLRVDLFAILPISRQVIYPVARGFAVRPLDELASSKGTPYPSYGSGYVAGSISVSPDESTLLATCGLNRACWFELVDKKLLDRHEFAEGAEVSSTAWSPDGKWAVISLVNGPLSIFDARTRKLSTALPLDTMGVFHLAFSADGKVLATGSYDKQVRLWDTTTWQQIRAMEGHEHGIRRVAFSPDGKTLASASWDRDLKLWDVATGRCLATLRGHLDQVSSVAFSPDGTLLASGGWDGMLRFWSVETHEELASFVSDEGRVWAITFSPDGKSLFYGGLRAHRLEFKPVGAPKVELQSALEAGQFRLEGPNLVR